MTENNSDLYLERCDLYAAHGFTVVAMAVNNRIGKLCVLRKSDYSRSKKKQRRSSENDMDNSSPQLEEEEQKDSPAEEPFFLVEFYNIISLPVAVLEKTVAVWTASLESVAWLENRAFVTCSDGGVMVFSPFSYKTERFQLSASSIIASAAISENRLAFGSESAEILLARYFDGAHSSRNAASDDLASAANSTKSTANLEVLQRLKLASDEQLISMAASKASVNLLAVGMINAVAIFDLAKGNRRTNIVVPYMRAKAIIWSMVFVDDLLFTGDSRGCVTIYKANTAAVLKVINSHQSAILAMAGSGNKVYASGVDYRIQVISGLSSKDRRFDWATTGQRTYHTNDVSAMVCVGERWLISGGAEHDFLVSDQMFNIHYPRRRPSCFFAREPDAGGAFVLMKHPHFLELWFRPDFSKFLADQTSAKKSAGSLLEAEERLAVEMNGGGGGGDAAESAEHHHRPAAKSQPETIHIGAKEAADGPKKLIQINASTNAFISQAAISPNAAFLAYHSDAQGLKVFSLNAETLLNSCTSKVIPTPSKRSRSTTTIVAAAQVLTKYWESATADEFSDNNNSSGGGLVNGGGDAAADAMDVDEEVSAAAGVARSVGGGGDSAATTAHKLAVSALLMTNEELYFAVGDFAIWRLPLNSRRKRKPVDVVAERHGAGHILKMCTNATKSALLAITTNSQVLKIGAPANGGESADDEEIGEQSVEDSIQTITLNYAAFDCVFVAESVALFACAEWDAMLVFVDVAANAVLRVLGKRELRVGYNQFVEYLSDVRDDRIILATNKGKTRTLSRLEKAHPILHLKKADGVKNTEKMSDFCHCEPFWGFAAPNVTAGPTTNGIDAVGKHDDADESAPITRRKSRTPKKPTAKAAPLPSADFSVKPVDDPLCVPSRTLLMVGYVPRAPPTQAPFKIKRYERN